MAGTGLAYFMAAKYFHDSSGRVQYRDGREFAGAIQMETEIKQADANPLYVNNALRESTSRFSSGTLTLTTDSLSRGASKFILGIGEETLEVDGKQIKYLVFNDAPVPDMGFGTVIYEQVKGVLVYTAVVLPKITFNVSGDSAKTQGESIEWQTTEVTATIKRDDTAKKGWRYKAEFTNEAEAVAFVRTFLNIVVDPLTVATVPGDAPGTAKIVVLPTLEERNSYFYQLGTALKKPVLNEELSLEFYTPWDGEAPVAATTGTQILVVEADADLLVKKAGIGTIRAKEEVLGALSVTSTAGTSAGKTKLEVLPALSAGNGYRYKIGLDLELPDINQDVAAWDEWNGNDEIAATAGEDIVIVEADAMGRAKKAGSATVTAA